MYSAKNGIRHKSDARRKAGGGALSVASAPAPRPGHPLQLFIAGIAVLFGIGLVGTALFLPPVGVIDPTVLTAYGETLTFAGALIGIDYHYRERGDPPQPSLQGREKRTHPNPPYKGGRRLEQIRKSEH